MDIRGFFSAGAKTAKKKEPEAKPAQAVVDLVDSDEEAQASTPKKRRLKTIAEKEKEREQAVKTQEEAKPATATKAAKSPAKSAKSPAKKQQQKKKKAKAKKDKAHSGRPKKKRTYGDSDDDSAYSIESSSDDGDESWAESGSEDESNHDDEESEEEEFVSEDDEDEDDEEEGGRRGKKRKKTTKATTKATKTKAAAKTRASPAKAAAKRNVTEVTPGSFFGEVEPATAVAAPAAAAVTSPAKASKHFAAAQPSATSTPSKGTKRAMPWEKSPVKAATTAVAATSSGTKEPSSAKKATPAKKLKLPDVDTTPSGPLANLTFVITGELGTMNREQAEDFIKEHGGRVTSAVSGKTSYLVAGERLEDGRPVDTSSKYQKAKSLQEANKPVKIISEEELLAMVQSASPTMEATTVTAPGASESKAAALPSAAGVATSKIAAIPVGTVPTSSQPVVAELLGNELWADKYAPQTIDDIVGHQSIAKKLMQWLQDWDRIHIRKEFKPAFNQRENMGAKAALLSGPPGIGKTTLAQVVAKTLGYEVLEMNASDTRNKSSVEEMLSDAAVSTAISGASGEIRRRIIIMDEVDGMSSSDRGGNQALIQVIKKSRTPIICICNDRMKNSVRSLANSCLDLKVTRPVKASMVKRLQQICQAEGMHVEPNALDLLVESCGNDFRQSLNALQMWSKSSSQISFRDMKDKMTGISKDKVLRMSSFDAVRAIISEVNTTSFRERFEAFFIDYNMTPLLVHQNYIKAVESSGRDQNELDVVDRLARAADAASDSELVGKMIMGGDQHWELLPSQAALNVRVGHIARGGIGMPGFPEWLGKYSTKTRKHRLTTELATHMSLAYSGSFESLRLHYVPVLRDMLLHSLLANESDGVNEVIQLLDAYGLSKDDFMENMKELQIGPSTAYDKIDSKMKAALTREFNKTAHKSQALVHDVQATKSKRGKAAAPTDEEGLPPLEGEADEVVEEEEAEEEDEDLSMFMKKSKGRASASSGKAAKASSASSSSKAAASSKGKGKARAK